MIRYLFVALCALSCSSQPIFGALSASDGKLYAVGWLGMTLSSSDGGKTWQDESNPTVETLNALTQDPDGTRYAAGDKGILLWARPGQAWSYAPTPNLKASLMGAFADARGVFVVGDAGLVMSSTDHGATWKTQTTTKSGLRDIKGDALGLYAVGQLGTLLCSFDNGASWMTAQTNTKETLHAVWGDGAGSLYAVGGAGVVIKSTDRCQAFQALTSGTTAALYEIVGKSPAEIYAVGGRGVILRSVDQGLRWLTLESDTPQELYAIAQRNGDWLALGANRSTATIPTLP